MSEKQVAKLLGGEHVLGARVTSRIGMSDAIARGLPERALEHVKELLHLTDAEIATTLGLSQKTISRLRKATAGKRLGPLPSDRLYRVARIFAFAEEVLEDATAAREWLRRPQRGLGERTPLELLSTEAGSREVEDLLGRIEFGVLA